MTKLKYILFFFALIFIVKRSVFIVAVGKNGRVKTNGLPFDTGVRIPGDADQRSGLMPHSFREMSISDSGDSS